MHLKFLPSFYLVATHLTSSNRKPYSVGTNTNLQITVYPTLLFLFVPKSTSTQKNSNHVNLNTNPPSSSFHKICTQISFSSNVYNRPTITAPGSRNVLHNFDVHIHIKKLLDSLMTPLTVWNMGLAQQSSWISVKLLPIPSPLSQILGRKEAQISETRIHMLEFTEKSTQMSSLHSIDEIGSSLSPRFRNPPDFPHSFSTKLAWPNWKKKTNTVILFALW